MISQAVSLDIPVLIAAGRLSLKSLKRYRILKPLFEDLIRKTDLIAAATPEDRERFLALGALPENTLALGNPKFDKLIDAARNIPYTPSSVTPPFVVTAGSTHPGEEELIIRELLKIRLSYSLKSGAKSWKRRLIFAPRHLSRVNEVLDLASKNGLTSKPISSADFERKELPDVSVVSVMGKLGEFYQKSDLTIVGGSFVQGQGHNPLEPAAAGRAVIFGPNMSSFSEPARYLMDNMGCKIVLPINLHSIFLHFTELPEVARNSGFNGNQAVAALKPAAPLIAENILRVLKKKGRL